MLTFLQVENSGTYVGESSLPLSEIIATDFMQIDDHELPLTNQNKEPIEGSIKISAMLRVSLLHLYVYPDLSGAL